MRLITRFVLLFGAALFLAACDEEDVPPPPPEITVRAEVVNGAAPVTTSATPVRETPEGEFAHEVRVEWDGDEAVILEDARFSHHVSNGGDLVIAGRGCGAEWEDELDQVVHPCTDDLQIIEVGPGEAHDYPVRIHPEVGPLQLEPGTYVVEEIIRWRFAEDDVVSPAEQADGEFTIRLTYEVE